MKMRFSSWLMVGVGFGIVGAACGGSVSLGTAGGQLGSTDGGGADGSSGGGAAECPDKSACGPQLGMPSYTCSDGSIGGNTGRCVKQPNGQCAWEIRSCPADTGTPSTGDCFDNGGNLLDAYKACTTADDCTVVDYPKDCCGNHNAAGVAKTREQEVLACASKRGATLPACTCPAGPPVADDATTDSTFSAKAQVTCRNNKCESTFKGKVCGSYICTANQTCCGPMPLPEAQCFDGTNAPCPESQRKVKKDIAYLSEADKERLSSELMSFPLATYRYKTEGNEQKPHLGFIIDDVAPSPAVLQSGERVDLYGYSTMTVAALQVQAKEIAELRKQVDELKRECAKRPAAKK